MITNKYKSHQKHFLFIVFLINIFSSDQLDSNDNLKHYPPLFIGLGSHCEIAVQLREHNLRKEAFPFDWILSLNHNNLINLLNNDFDFFLNEEYFIQHPIHPSIVRNYYYELEFGHDWPFTELWSNSIRFKTQLQGIQSKYEKRISRFRKLKNYPGKVLFFRIPFDFEIGPNPYGAQRESNIITIGQAQELKAALDHYFPLLNFTLVIFNYHEENTPIINQINGVIEFKIKKSNKNNSYNNAFKTIQELQKLDDLLLF